MVTGLLDGEEFLAGRCIPNCYGPVPRTACQALAIGAVCQAVASWVGPQDGEEFLAGLGIPYLPGTGQAFAIRAEGHVAASVLEREQIRVAQPVEIIPLEVSEVAIPRLGPVPLQKLSHAPDAARLPGVLGQVHVGYIQRALKLVVQGTDLVALVFRLLLLLLGLGGVLLGLEFIGLCY